MYRTILVPLDGSTYSERALPIAVSLQRLLGAPLVLVRAANASVIPGTDPTHAQCQAIDEATAYIQGVADLLEQQGVRAEVAVPYGEAAGAIRLEIKLRQADLVVMCTHGRSGLGRWIYGSVAESLLAHSATPILLVRPTGAPVRLVEGPEPPRLIVPLDGSPFAEAALPYAVELACAMGAGIELLQVVPPAAQIFPEQVLVSQLAVEDASRLVEEDCAQAAAYLAEVAGQLQVDGPAIHTSVQVGHPADVILGQAQTTGARLLVLATHGRTGLRRLLMGSVAQEIVHHTLLPVLLVHPDAAPE